MDPMSTPPSTPPNAPDSESRDVSYTINPLEDLLLSFDNDPSLVCKRTPRSRVPSSEIRRKKRLSNSKPQMSEDTLNDVPVWAFWYAVFEFLHMEVFSDYDVVFGIIVYMWAALYITTQRQYYE